MNYFKRAKELENEVKTCRRAIHEFAEIGFELPKTVNYVKAELEKYGIEAKLCGKAGIVATIGKKEGETILLRADMDALPMQEESNELFKALNGNCHSCGHDSHTAMLLLAGKMLKENEENINGRVKLMFQPAEELLAGANDMVENGVLEGVTKALALHIEVGTDYTEMGTIRYSKGSAMFSGDAIKIEITGKDAHGSMPEKGVDAINVAAHTVIALQEIISREISCRENCVVLVGKISGGTTCNTVAGYAELECSVRATTQTTRDFIKERIKDVAQGVATTFRANANVIYQYGMPPLETDIKFSEEMAEYASEIAKNVTCVEPICGTEDFTVIAKEVPSAYFFLGAGSKDEGHEYGMHHPKMTIDENVLAYGASILANCATKTLNKK